MWSLFHSTGRTAPPSMFPAVCQLYYAAEHAWKFRTHRATRLGFVYVGKRYRWSVTNLGRLKVFDESGDTLLIQGGIGAID